MVRMLSIESCLSKYWKQNVFNDPRRDKKECQIYCHPTTTSNFLHSNSQSPYKGVQGQRSSPGGLLALSAQHWPLRHCWNIPCTLPPPRLCPGDFPSSRSLFSLIPVFIVHNLSCWAFPFSFPFVFFPLSAYHHYFIYLVLYYRLRYVHAIFLRSRITCFLHSCISGAILVE